MEEELFEQLLQSVKEVDNIRLSNEAWKQFEAILDKPPKATPTLEELLSQCDEVAPVPEGFELWDKMKSVGNEIIQD